MNVLKNTNAKKGPHDAFNAYSEYNDKELDGQILAIAMTYFGMENVDGKRNIVYRMFVLRYHKTYTIRNSLTTKIKLAIRIMIFRKL